MKNIFTQVTVKTMKCNRMRTLVTIIGIVISAAMFTAVTTFAASLYQYIYKTVAYNDGTYQLMASDINYEQYDRIINDSRFDMVGTAVGYGYAYVENDNEYKPYVYVLGADEKTYSLLPIHLISGRMPENEGEIIIPDNLYQNMTEKYHVGDKVSFDLGERYSIYDEKQTYSLKQTNPYNIVDGKPDEVFVSKQTKEYTVVGFYERLPYEIDKYSAPGYLLLTCKDVVSNNIAGNNSLNNVAVADENADEGAIWTFLTVKKNIVRKSVWDISLDYIYDDTELFTANYDLLSMMFVSRYTNLQTFLTAIVIVFVMIIIVGSVSMIYSALSISVSERTKQFGLLSSIGATKKQIRKCVFVEAFLNALIGIPVGILCGVIGIGITLKFTGSKFTYFYSSPYSVDLVVNGYALLAATVVSFATIMISAIIPARRATRVSAIEAIRQNKDIRRERKLVKRKYRLTFKIFGTPGMLARRYFSRSRRKYRVTVFSLAMSVALFVSTTTYCEYLGAMVGDGSYNDTLDCDYTYASNEDDIQSVAEILKAADNVKSMTYTSDKYVEIDCTGLEFDESYIEYLTAYNEVYGGYRETEEDTEENTEENNDIYARIMFIDDASYAAYLKVLGLDKNEEYTQYADAPGILYNKKDSVLYAFNEKDGSYERKSMSYRILAGNVDKVIVKYYQTDSESIDTDETYVNVEYPVGEVTDKFPENMGESSLFGIVFPYSSVYNQGKNDITVFALRHMDSSSHESMVDSVENKLKDAGYMVTSTNVVDVFSRQMEKKNMIEVINVFSYGFIILMALICVANVFNTITTNIILRRRDFAMLRSVGMSERGIRVMMSYECILYGLRSIVFGMLIALLCSFALFGIYGGIGNFGFYMPVWAVVTAVVGVFMVVGISMVYALGKLKKDNLIEELKSV